MRIPVLGAWLKVNRDLILNTAITTFVPVSSHGANFFCPAEQIAPISVEPPFCA